MSVLSIGQRRRSFTTKGVSAAELEKRYNLNQIQRFEAVLNRHGLSFRGCSSILDFGCGWGRLAQYLDRVAPGAHVFGCDVQRDDITRCRRKCPQGTFIVNQPVPPLGFADAQFDLIYAYSVFTHLSEPHHAAWLRELARVLRPGGILLVTIHSHESIRRRAVFSPESLVKYRLQGSPEAFIRSGQGYHFVMDDPATPEYGLTIISRAYVEANWPCDSGLKLRDYEEGAIEAYPEGCHDLVMLRKD